MNRVSNITVQWVSELLRFGSQACAVMLSMCMLEMMLLSFFLAMYRIRQGQLCEGGAVKKSFLRFTIQGLSVLFYCLSQEVLTFLQSLFLV